MVNAVLVCNRMHVAEYSWSVIVTVSTVGSDAYKIQFPLDWFPVLATRAGLLGHSLVYFLWIVLKEQHNW